MSLPETINFLEEALPCTFDEFSDCVWTTVLAGSRTTLRIDSTRGEVLIQTPVNGAHNGLRAQYLLELLMLNAPNDFIGHSFLAQGRAAGHLDLIDLFPVTSATSQQILDRILEQITASAELAERIVEARRGSTPLFGDK